MLPQVLTLPTLPPRDPIYINDTHSYLNIGEVARDAGDVLCDGVPSGDLFNSPLRLSYNLDLFKLAGQMSRHTIKK